MLRTTSFSLFSQMPTLSPFPLALMITDDRIYKILSTPFKAIGNLVTRMMDTSRENTPNPLGRNTQPTANHAKEIRTILREPGASNAIKKMVTFGDPLVSEREIPQRGIMRKTREFHKSGTIGFLAYRNKDGKRRALGRWKLRSPSQTKPTRDAGIRPL
ncbi:MAG: hypothetical protein V4492_01810 [Chlamydiota bacterium]